MGAVSYDLHVHPAPSAAPRWGDGRRVWEAAAAAGVDGFVWKSHEEHTVDHCRALPQQPVRPIASATLNPWARFDDIIRAVEDGALWMWGPTMTADREIGWDLPLPAEWHRVADWLVGWRRPLVLATGHLGTAGRAAFAALAAEHDGIVCSVTHALYVPIEEALGLAEQGCIFEIDAFTYTFPVEGRPRGDLQEHVEALTKTGSFLYFTSDGGQAATGDPFAFGALVLARISEQIGPEAAATLAVDHPAALVRRLEPGGAR